MNLNDFIKKQYKAKEIIEYSLEDYLGNCAKDPTFYATPAERMVNAIGEPKLIDTSEDEKLSRIFLNRTVSVYPTFEDFYGMEDTIEKIVSFFKHAAQGLEEKKQVLYLLGPVGGGKSSLAERLKALMEDQPIYVLRYKGEISPVYESPLGLFHQKEMKEYISENYKIDSKYLQHIPSPWAVKRLNADKGDLSNFDVVRMFPSKLNQVAIAKTEPGDENNQDISSLVGKVDLRKLDTLPQNDADAYSYSGALCNGNQGMVEMVEIWKAPIKTLHPLLTATQEGNYVGTEEIGAIPFQGIIIAHSNESEWAEFSGNKKNEAFLDRICTIKVPYCLRLDEEVLIYKKMLEGSSLRDAPCAPQTLEMLAQFCIMSRLKEHENSNLYSKMKVYNGENLKDIDPRAKSPTEYKEAAGNDEGFGGISTRFAYKILSNTFNYDPTEVAADPVHLLNVLVQTIKTSDIDEETKKKYMVFIKEQLSARYLEFIAKELQQAYIHSYADYGQNIFENYLAYADNWIEESDYKDPDTGQIWSRDILNQELEKIEKPAGISNPKDFRQEIVKYALRARAKNNGKYPDWREYEKFKIVIEKKMFSNMDDLLPVISFGAKKTAEEEKKHADFIARMSDKEYTLKQIRRAVEYYIRASKN